MPGAQIGVEQIEGHESREAADLGLQITTTRADGMTDAAAAVGDEAGHFLDARSRRPDDADVATRDGIGEAERNATEDRGAAVGSHDQHASGLCGLLQRDLVGNRNVVGKHHDVEAMADRLHRLGRCINAGHGDQREVGAAQHRLG